MARSTSSIDHTRDLTLFNGSVASSLDLQTDHVFRVLPQTATSNTTLTSNFSILRTRRTMSGDLACTYAALILSDDGQEVTGDKMDTIIKAAGVTIEPYWTMLFSKFLSSKPLRSSSPTSVPAAAVAVAAAVVPLPAAAAAMPRLRPSPSPRRRRRRRPWTSTSSIKSRTTVGCLC